MSTRYRRLLTECAKRHAVALMDAVGVCDDRTYAIACIAIAEAAKRLSASGDDHAITQELQSGVVVAVQQKH